MLGELGVINGHVTFNIFHNNLTAPQCLEILQNYIKL